jgi:ADP-heptose:LPS heptosyltransferase
VADRNQGRKAAPIVDFEQFERVLTLNILVVRACAIGDFVLNFPALQALQSHDKGVRLTLLGYAGTLELARDFVEVAAIHSIESAPWNRLFHEPVNGLNFDRAIVWMKDPALAHHLRHSGITDVLRADPFPVKGHAAAHLVHTIGLTSTEPPDMWRAHTDRIILHPGSGSRKKCWPHFRELADRLDRVTYLIGPAESDFDTGAHPRLENLPLREVARELAAAPAFIGNDSGITHLAAYLGCPTIAIFGPTDPSVWGPIGRRVTILSDPTLTEVIVSIPSSKAL